MKHNHRYSVFTTVTLLLWATFSFAQPAIPQAVLDEIAANGTARIIVGLDVPWQPEGFLRLDAVATQRSAIATTQDDFVETFNDDVANAGIIDDAHSGGGEPTIPAQRTFSTIPYLVMKVSSVTLPYVQQNAKTTSIELSTVDEPSLQDSLPLIGADKALQKGYGGKGQLIAIVDTGVDKNHPFFSPGRVVKEACFSITLCPNGELVQKGETGAAVPCDFLEGCEHGTHVAGIAASVAKEAKIIAVQAASDALAIDVAKFDLGDQLAALDWLQDIYGYHGSPLAAVNMSLGSGEFATACNDDENVSARAKVIQNLHSVGIATIASSGNRGYTNGISAPACISEVISVGATDKDNKLWSESNRGNLLDLLAPGVDIVSAISGGGTQAMSGTSMAAPHVAGAWALLKAAYPDKGIAEILAMLKNTGQDVDGTPLIQLDAALPKTSCDIVPEGQIACYPFDGNAQDATGNKNNGTEQGGLSYATGRIGQAAQFDGVDDFIQITPQSDVAQLTDMSMAVWIYTTTQTEGRDYLFDGRDHSTSGSDLTKEGAFLSYYHLNGSGQIRNGFASDNGDNTVEQRVATDALNGAWHHLALVRNGSDLITYLNGESIKTESLGNQTVNMAHNWFIGTFSGYEAAQDNYAFEGLMDDFRLYNRALSDSEITELASIEEPPTDPSCEVVKDGQVACYPFSGNANDATGNGNDGTVNGATLTTDRSGNTDSAYNFDGDDFVQFDSPVQAESPLSVSLWFNYAALPPDSSYLIANGAESRNSQGFYVFIDATGALRFGVGQESLNFKMSVVTSNPITLNQWHHVTGTWDGTTDAENLKLYLDGQLAEVNVTPGNTFFGPPRNLMIGLPSNQNNYPAIGQIDDVIIYNRVITDSEITQLARIEKEPIVDPVPSTDQNCEVVKDGLVACYPFSGNAYDGSGKRHHGTVNGATLTTDRNGNAESAYEFDGINSLVTVPDNTSINFGPNQDFSLSAWFKATPNQASSQGTILSKLNPATSTLGKRAKGYSLMVLGEEYLDNEGKVCVRLGDGTGGDNGGDKLCSNRAYDDDNWHHVVATIDRDNVATLSVDGTLSNSADVSHLASLDLSYPEELEIGREGVFDTYVFNGAIDDILIYNRVITEAEIKQLAGIEEEPVDPSCDVVKDGLVGCYPFNENALDGSGNGLHGTVNGATLTEDRFGNPDSAYYFDGQGFINLGNSPQFDVNHHTITAWVNSEDTYRLQVILGKVNLPIHEAILLTLRENNLAAGFATGTEINHRLHGSSVLESNQWHFVAVTYDGETATLYVDGNVDSSFPRTGTVRTNSNNLAIGRHSGDIDINGTQKFPFRGSMDEVRLYNRALSEAEIQTLYNLGDENISSCTQWNPETDYLALSQPENPYRDSCGNQGVWHMMESETLERNPQSYSLLSRYTNEGLYTDDGIGIYHWSGSFSINGKSYRPLARIGNVFGMHPAPDRLVVLGWQSPIDGTVEITGFVKNTEDGGTTWFLDQGITNLASGEVIDGAIQLFKEGANTDLNHVEVRQGEFLYFVIDPRSAPNSCFAQGIANCDSTQLDISIKLVEDNQPSENSLSVNKAGEGRGTLRAKLKGEDWNLVCQSDCSEASEIYPLDSQVILTASPEKGFLFSGWSGDCTGTETRLTFTMNGAKTCIAQFEPDVSNSALLTISTDGPGQGTVISTDSYINCGLDCSAFYRLDKSVNLEATPNANNLFIGWSGDCSGIKNPLRITMDAAKNCTATFNTKPSGALTLSVDKIGDGQAVITGRFNGERTLYCDKSCQQASYDYQAGDQVILNVNPKDGFIFKEWTGDCSGTEPKITVLMDDAKHCTAQIDRDPNLVWYELTINNIGTGKGSVTASGLNCTETSCTVYYQPDETVRLTATRALFSKFVGWSGDCEGTKNFKLTMTGDLTCTAEFKSEFELLVEQMVDAFYANATLENGDSVATMYPQNADNQARLKEAFWVNLPALMEVDQHLGISNSQLWPNQFNDTEWLPSDANTEYTQSIQIQSQAFVGIKVELLNNAGQTETIPVIIYYSDAMPVIDDGGGWYLVSSVYFSRYVVPTWWW